MEFVDAKEINWKLGLAIQIVTELEQAPLTRSIDGARLTLALADAHAALERARREVRPEEQTFSMEGL